MPTTPSAASLSDQEKTSSPRNEELLQVPKTESTITMESGRGRQLARSKSWMALMERNQTLRKHNRKPKSSRSVHRELSQMPNQFPPSSSSQSLSQFSSSTSESDKSEDTAETKDLKPKDLQKVNTPQPINLMSKSLISLKTNFEAPTSDLSDSEEDAKFQTPPTQKCSLSSQSSFQPIPYNDDLLPHPSKQFTPQMLQTLDPHCPGPVCAICHHSDVGYLINPCTCKTSKPVHFHCIKQKILKRRSLHCIHCDAMFKGIEPLYDHISASRILLASFRFFISLLALLIVKYLFFVAPDYNGYFQSFFCFFFGICALTMVMYAILFCYSWYYNRHNQLLVDAVLEPDNVFLLV